MSGELEDKPDVTSADYRAGLDEGIRRGRADAKRQAQDRLSRLAWEVRRGQHQKNTLQILREAWRRIAKS